MESQLNNNLDEIIIDKKEEKKNYSWNVEGNKILNSNKNYLSDDDLTTIHYCFQNPLPDNLREEYWLLITGAKELKIKNPNYYDNILNNYLENPISERNEKQILLDIHRTFPEDEYFNEEKINSLKNVLIAYSRRNCTLGYCQGFNYIVGKLLKVIKNEENVFWIFTQIIENILPINYYYDSIGIIIDNNILIDILKNIDKELILHFSKHNFELLIKNILYKWLICLFSQNIKDELLFLIWDIFFIEGTPTLFKTIIIILEKNREKLMKITQIDKLVDLFDSVHSLNLLNQHKEELLKDLLKYNKKISNSMVIKGRKKYYKEVKDSIKCLKNKFSTPKLENCSEEWDNCCYIKRKFDWDDNVVYQKTEKMEIINNYYKKKIERCNSMKVKGNKNIFKKMINKYHQYENLLIQRRIHKCPNGFKKMISERMKSCIDLNKNIVKDILNDKHKFNKSKKLKIKEKNNNNKMDDNYNNKNEDSICNMNEYNDYFIYNF